MDITEYQLKSKPGTSIRVPEDYVDNAQRLVDHSLLGMGTLRANIDNHQPYLGNPGIISRARALAESLSGSDESLRLQDILYLRVCNYSNERKIGGPDHDEAFELDGPLIQIIEDLERQ